MRPWLPAHTLIRFLASLLLASAVCDTVYCALQSFQTPARRVCLKTLRHTKARAADMRSAAGQRVTSRCAARVWARTGGRLRVV